MNKGDRIICIKTYILSITEFFIKGKIYEVIRVGIDGVYITSSGNIFPLSDIEMSKYFMLYNEWLAKEREKKMKKLLDD